MSWHDQVALVTGASRGIGRATALRLARSGAAVAVNYATSVAQAAAVVDEIVAAGGRATAVGADVAEPEQVRAMVAHVAAALGPISILVNNAGFARQATLDTFDAQALARMRRVNVDGPIAAIRFKWTVRSTENGDYYVEETIGANSAPLVNGPMEREAAIKLVDEREREAKLRFDQLRSEMTGRAAAASMARKAAGEV